MVQEHEIRNAFDDAVTAIAILAAVSEEDLIHESESFCEAYNDPDVTKIVKQVVQLARERRDASQDG
jgi:hypothetical protein